MAPRKSCRGVFGDTLSTSQDDVDGVRHCQTRGGDGFLAKLQGRMALIRTAQGSQDSRGPQMRTHSPDAPTQPIAAAVARAASPEVPQTGDGLAAASPTPTPTFTPSPTPTPSLSSLPTATATAAAAAAAAAAASIETPASRHGHAGSPPPPLTLHSLHAFRQLMVSPQRPPSAPTSHPSPSTSPLSSLPTSPASLLCAHERRRRRQDSLTTSALLGHHAHTCTAAPAPAPPAAPPPPAAARAHSWGAPEPQHPPASHAASPYAPMVQSPQGDPVACLSSPAAAAPWCLRKGDACAPAAEQQEGAHGCMVHGCMVPAPAPAYCLAPPYAPGPLCSQLHHQQEPAAKRARTSPGASPQPCVAATFGPSCSSAAAPVAHPAPAAAGRTRAATCSRRGGSGSSSSRSPFFKAPAPPVARSAPHSSPAHATHASGTPSSSRGTRALGARIGSAGGCASHQGSSSSSSSSAPSGVLALGASTTSTPSASSAPAVNPRAVLWVPPASPFSLLEEVLYEDPWKLLVACMLLNKTSSTQVRLILGRIFALYPNPEALAALHQPPARTAGKDRKRHSAVKRAVPKNVAGAPTATDITTITTTSPSGGAAALAVAAAAAATASTPHGSASPHSNAGKPLTPSSLPGLQPPPFCPAAPVGGTEAAARDTAGAADPLPPSSSPPSPQAAAEGGERGISGGLLLPHAASCCPMLPHAAPSSTHSPYDEANPGASCPPSLSFDATPSCTSPAASTEPTAVPLPLSAKAGAWPHHATPAAAGVAGGQASLPQPVAAGAAGGQTSLPSCAPAPAATGQAEALTALQQLLRPLGLFRKRAVMLARFSFEYLHMPWTDPQELHGIGQYGADAYWMFCRGRWQDINPTDKDLKKYREWLLHTGGEGAGLQRESLAEVLEVHQRQIDDLSSTDHATR